MKEKILLKNFKKFLGIDNIPNFITEIFCNENAIYIKNINKKELLFFIEKYLDKKYEIDIIYFNSVSHYMEASKDAYHKSFSFYSGEDRLIFTEDNITKKDYLKIEKFNNALAAALLKTWIDVNEK